MAKRWAGLVGVTPLLLGMMVSVPQMVVAPVILAQTSQGSQATEAQRLINEGVRLRQQGTRESFQQALDKFQQALTLFRAIGNRREEAVTLNNIGEVYDSIGQPQRALEFFQQSLPITREVNDRDGEAVILNNIGLMYSNIGQPQRALEFFQQSLPIRREVNNRAGEAVTLSNIGAVYDSIGQPQRALEFYQQALPITREVNDRRGEAATLNGIGLVYDRIGQPQKALEFYQQALPITREVNDRSREAATLNNIGLVYDRIGQPQRALEFYQQSLPITREVNDRRGEALSLNNIGLVYDSIGQPQRALEFYQQALPIRREVNDRSGEAATLNNIGLVYDNIGQPQRALEFYQQSLPILREVNNRSGEATTLSNIGWVYDRIGQPQRALEFYQQALTILREVNNRSGEATTLSNIGLVYDSIGQPQRALEFYQQALLITREVNDRRREATTLNNIGLVYTKIGQPQRALEFYQQALTILREVNDRKEEANTLTNLAFLQQTLKDIPTALQNIQAAISIVEDIRGQLIDPDSRTSYFASVQSYYKLQIDLLMELHQKNPDQGYAAQAFNVTERSKARTLLELLTESKADIRTGVDPQLLQQEKDIQTQLNALDKRQVDLINQKRSLVNSIPTNNPSPEQAASLSNIETQLKDLQTQRQTLQTQFQELQTKIRTTSPKYAALKYPQPLTLEQIQQQILDDNTVILSYSLGQDKSYLWLISKTEMTSYELPNQKIIENLINGNDKVRSQLTNPRTSRETFLRETSQLSNILLKPIQEKIGNKRLAIIGDGALQYVPFGALPDPRAEANQYQPLLVNNEIVYLPSASTLQTIRTETQNRPTAPRSIAIIADPVFLANDSRVSQGAATTATTTTTNEIPFAAQNLANAARSARGGDWNRLPGTRQETATILKLFPPDSSLSFLDFQANRTNAQSSQLAQYRFIHWATHGFVNTEKPELSGVVMSLVQENGQPQDGYLLLGDIFNLSFNADLVVLSACETGRGQVIQGEGLIGLTRGLMYAGTPRVITSLWVVPDAETATLMGKFYEKMLQQNLKPAEALRAAQLEMWRSRTWMAPYYWAAFTLQGEWR